MQRLTDAVSTDNFEFWKRWHLLSCFGISIAVSFSQCGGLAQLGEHLAGSQKVRGSSPLSSTLLCGTRSHRAADPSTTGVFFCAGKSSCDSLQPLAGTVATACYSSRLAFQFPSRRTNSVDCHPKSTAAVHASVDWLGRAGRFDCRFQASDRTMQLGQVRQNSLMRMFRKATWQPLP